MASIIALGSKLEWKYVTGHTVYGTIVQLTKLDGPNPKVEFAETTALDSAGGKKTRIPTVVDEGEVSFEGIWDPDDLGHQALRTDCLAKTSAMFKVTNTDATPSTLEGTGYVAELNYPRELTGSLKFSGKIVITGGVTVA